MRQKASAIVLIGLALAVAPAAAIAVVAGVGAQQTTPVATASLRGRVIAGDTELPVRGAAATLSSPNAPPSIAISDDDGRFEFRDVPAGRYILRIAKTGFVSTLYDLKGLSNALFEIRAGQSVERGDLKLPKAGVIAGRVTDSYGDPAAEISVTAWRVDYFTPGERRMVSVRSVETNDLGEYRLFGLAPGKYYVSASVRGTFASAGESGTAAVSPIGGAGQAPTFYPGTANGLDAQPVFVKVNEDSPGINIRIQAMSFTRVAGVVVDSAGRPARDVVVMVNPSRADGAMYYGSLMNMAEADANGRFAIPAVPPGEYRVDVVAKVRLETIGRGGSTGDAWKIAAESASVPLVATGERLPELFVTTKAGARLSGRVLVDDVPVPPELAAKLHVVAFPVVYGQGLTVPLLTVSGSVDQNGSFVVPGVHGPRLIRVLGAPASVTLRRVIALGSDVADAGLEIGQDNVGGIEIQLTTKPTQLVGIVTNPAGAPLPGSAVIVFSEDRHHWTNLQNRRVTSAQASSKDGSYEIAGLPAGRYLAIAVAELERGQWADPDNLERLRAAATSFTLTDGEKRSLTLVRR